MAMCNMSHGLRLLRMGVPPGAEDPLSRADRDREWVNISRSEPDLTPILECQVSPEADVRLLIKSKLSEAANGQKRSSITCETQLDVVVE